MVFGNHACDATSHSRNYVHTGPEMAMAYSGNFSDIFRVCGSIEKPIESIAGT